MPTGAPKTISGRRFCRAAIARARAITATRRALRQSQLGFDRGKACLQFNVLGFELCIQALDRGKRNAVGIHGGDVLLVLASTESGMEILGHRADVLAFGGIAVGPARDRERDHLAQHFARIDGRKAFLEQARGTIGPASASSKFGAVGCGFQEVRAGGLDGQGESIVAVLDVEAANLAAACAQNEVHIRIAAARARRNHQVVVGRKSAGIEHDATIGTYHELVRRR